MTDHETPVVFEEAPLSSYGEAAVHSPTPIRVGGALVQLLIQKGVFTEEEYVQALAGQSF